MEWLIDRLANLEWWEVLLLLFGLFVTSFLFKLWFEVDE